MKHRNFIIPLSNGILERKHREKIGPAIWVFLWLVDKSTKDVPVDGGFEGLVLGGKPINTSTIAEQLGESARSVRYHLESLAMHGYIRVTANAGDANSYAVRKSKKFYRARAVLVGPELDDQDHSDPGNNLQPTEAEPLQEAAGGVAESCQGGGNIFPPYKEEIPRIKQGDTSKPLRKRKEADPRRALFIDDWKKFFEHKNQGVKFTFNGRDGKSLDVWMKDHPEIERTDWQKILNNRARSPGPMEADGISFDSPLYSWISRAQQYLSGPKNRYWQPVIEKAGKNGQQKSETIRTNLTAALDRRRAGRMAGATAGNDAEPVTKSTSDRGSQCDVSSRA